MEIDIQRALVQCFVSTNITIQDFVLDKLNDLIVDDCFYLTRLKKGMRFARFFPWKIIEALLIFLYLVELSREIF